MQFICTVDLGMCNKSNALWISFFFSLANHNLSKLYLLFWDIIIGITKQTI